MIIPDLWHSIWFDDHHDEIVEMMKDWINDRAFLKRKKEISG